MNNFFYNFIPTLKNITQIRIKLVHNFRKTLKYFRYKSVFRFLRF